MPRRARGISRTSSSRTNTEKGRQGVSHPAAGASTRIQNARRAKNHNIGRKNKASEREGGGRYVPVAVARRVCAVPVGRCPACARGAAQCPGRLLIPGKAERFNERSHVAGSPWSNRRREITSSQLGAATDAWRSLEQQAGLLHDCCAKGRTADGSAPDCAASRGARRTAPGGKNLKREGTSC